MNESEVIRYEHFCQFKAEIRSSGDYLIVGIDVAKGAASCIFWHSFGSNAFEALAL